MNLTENLFSNSFARALCIFGTSRGTICGGAASAPRSFSRSLSLLCILYIKEGRPRANCAESSLHARTHKRHKRVSDGENSVRKRERRMKNERRARNHCGQFRFINVLYWLSAYFGSRRECQWVVAWKRQRHALIAFMNEMGKQNQGF